MVRTIYMWWDDDNVSFVLDQHNEVDFYKDTTETTVQG